MHVFASQECWVSKFLSHDPMTLSALVLLSQPEMLPQLSPVTVPAMGASKDLWLCRAVALLKSPLKLDLQTLGDGFAQS